MQYAKRKTGMPVKTITGITFVAMVAVNALANILPINGVGTGEVSDSYPNLFAPAGITFAIWGVIYLLLAAYTLHQFGLFRRGWSKDREDLYHSIGILFSLSSIANSIWIFAWHYRMLSLSLVLMGIILICLILINARTHKADLTQTEKLFVRLPFSVYFGWITVATIANVTTFLVATGWRGSFLPESVWTILVILVGLLIGVVTMVRYRDIPYGLVIVWAYGGILIRHTAEQGFSGAYPSIIMVTAACIVILLLGMFKILTGRRRGIFDRR